MALIDLLGKDVAGILVGSAEVFVGAKTSNGGAGTLFSAGYTTKPSSFEPNIERTDIFVEQANSAAQNFVTGAAFKIKAILAQNNLQNMRMALSQASGTLTGAANGALLVINEPLDESFQVQLKTPGPGTGTTHAGTKVDTYTFWNCKISQDGPLTFDKKGVQEIPITISILPDSTIVGSPEFVKGLYGNRGLA